MKEKQFSSQNSSILIIDDVPENLRYLDQILTASGYHVRVTTESTLALEVAKNINFDLILLDIKMPKMDGYETSYALQNNERTKDIPIIFISALNDIEAKVKAFDAGGIDYITKPFEEKEVLARVDIHLQLHKKQMQIENLLEQQDYFTKKIMHEMNTPVSVISLNAQALEHEIGEHIYIDTIKASSKNLASIYDDLNYLIKKQTYHYSEENIPIVEFISARIGYFHELAKIKHIELNLELNHEYLIHMNDTELERLIDNTLSNAIKYSHEHSTIDIFIGKDKEKYILSIQDYGLGIDDTEAIFGKYYQVSSTHKGLGIGMVTVKEICEKYDITLDVKSKKEIGSTFTYIFNHTMIEAL